MKEARPFSLWLFLSVVLISLLKSYFENRTTYNYIPSLIASTIASSIGELIIPFLIGGIVAGIDKYKGKIKWDKAITIFASVWLCIVIIQFLAKFKA